jgi:hypothetical protein
VLNTEEEEEVIIIVDRRGPKVVLEVTWTRKG